MKTILFEKINRFYFFASQYMDNTKKCVEGFVCASFFEGAIYISDCIFNDRLYAFE